MAEKRYLQIKPEHLDKLNISREQEVKVDAEWMIIAEFGKHFGWAGITAILNNEIDTETVVMLLAGARKVDISNTYRASQAALIGSAAANSERPSEAFEKMTNDMLKKAKADL